MPILTIISLSLLFTTPLSTWFLPVSQSNQRQHRQCATQRQLLLVHTYPLLLPTTRTRHHRVKYQHHRQKSYKLHPLVLNSPTSTHQYTKSPSRLPLNENINIVLSYPSLTPVTLILTILSILDQFVTYIWSESSIKACQYWWRDILETKCLEYVIRFYLYDIGYGLEVRVIVEVCSVVTL